MYSSTHVVFFRKNIRGSEHNMEKKNNVIFKDLKASKKEEFVFKYPKYKQDKKKYNKNLEILMRGVSTYVNKFMVKQVSILLTTSQYLQNNFNRRYSTYDKNLFGSYDFSPHQK